MGRYLRVELSNLFHQNALTHLALQATYEACKTFQNPEKTEMDAYNTYLANRANWLGLNPHLQIERVLTRVGAMLRLFTPEEGAILEETVSKLSADVQANLIAQLDIRQGEALQRTPTYMPACLVNLVNNCNMGSSKTLRLSKAITLGLPFIARVLKAHKQHLEIFEADSTIPLNFNPVALTAKIDPEALKGEFLIDPEGNVMVVGN